MKKIKIIFLNTLIIVFISAFFSFAAEPKSTPISVNSSKEGTPANAVSAKSDVQPTQSFLSKLLQLLHISDKSNNQPTKAAKITKAQGNTQPAPSKKANVPAQGPIQKAPASNTTQIKLPLVSPVANVPAQSPTKLAASAVNPTQIKQQPISPAANVTPTPLTTVPVQASPALNKVDVYSYNPSGKPDPFRPFIEVETAKPHQVKAKAADKKEPLSIFPLQRAETDKYKVVGIVGSEDHRAAIAEDAAKKFYPLLIGTRIGLRNGKVVEIMADRVIVEEHENNKEKRVILKLRKN
jgi:type IV pilus assembly protein PilP